MKVPTWSSEEIIMGNIPRGKRRILKRVMEVKAFFASKILLLSTRT